MNETEKMPEKRSKITHGVLVEDYNRLQAFCTKQAERIREIQEEKREAINLIEQLQFSFDKYGPSGFVTPAELSQWKEWVTYFLFAKETEEQIRKNSKPLRKKKREAVELLKRVKVQGKGTHSYIVDCAIDSFLSTQEEN